MLDLLPDLPTILAFGGAVILLTLVPGPDLVLFLSRAIAFGRPHGYAAMAGAMTGLLLHATLAAFGLSVLLAAAPTLFFALKIAGALYLLWLALGALRAGTGFALPATASTAPTLVNSYLTGLGINLLNPKIVMFFVTFLPQFVARTDPHAPVRLFALGIEFIIIALPLVSLMIYAAGALTRLLSTRPGVTRGLNLAIAGLFASFAAALLVTEVRR